jgi:hypothetical protein
MEQNDFSMEMIVCLVTPMALASVSWDMSPRPEATAFQLVPEPHASAACDLQELRTPNRSKCKV